MSIRFEIDNQEVKAENGEMLLDVARRNGIEIPSLCHKESLPAIGACRLCLVEVEQDGQRDLTTSCNYRVEAGMKVWTESAEVQRHRAMNMELLLARAPNAPKLKAFAADLGVNRTRFGPAAYNPLANCILCELCVRACAKLGNNVLTMVGRGEKKRVGMAFNEPSDKCKGCAACVAVCPTDCIPIKDTATERTIWGQKLEFALCKSCGQPVMTKRQQASAIKGKGLPEDYYDTCESCKQAATSERFAEVVIW